MGAQQGKGEAAAAAPPKQQQPAQQQQPAKPVTPPPAPVQQQQPGAKPPTPQPASNPSPISQQKQQPIASPAPSNLRASGANQQVTQRTAGGADEEGEDELDTLNMGQTAGGTNRATFIGNTARDPKNPTGSVDPLQKQGVTSSLPAGNTLQKSDPNQILNRFKDEPVTLKQSQAPSQAQVNTVIESYQQQLKDMKQSVNDMGRLTQGQGTIRNGLSQYTIQEEDEISRRGPMDQTNRITTFRTEMFPVGDSRPNAVLQNNIIEKQNPNLKGSIEQNPLSNHTTLQAPPSSVKPQSYPPLTQKDGYLTIQTMGTNKQSQPGGLLGEPDPSVIQQMEISDRSGAMSDGAPYIMAYPDYRQDSRPNFNVDFQKDQKPNTIYQQQPSSQIGGGSQGQQVSTMRQQTSMQPISQATNQFGAARQESRPSAFAGGPPSIQQQHSIQKQPSFQQQPQPPVQIQQNQHQSDYSQPNQSQRTVPQPGSQHSHVPSQQQQQPSIYVREHPIQDSYQQDSYQVPSRKEAVLIKPPVPRDQLLTAEQKALLQLGQRDDHMQRKLDQPLITQLHAGHEDEDELGISGYYNFDKPEQEQMKAEQFAFGRNFQKQEQHIPQQPQAAYMGNEEDVDHEPIQENQQKRASQHSQPSHAQGLAQTQKESEKPHITMDELQFLKEQHIEQEERERLNPQNVLVRLLFIHAFNNKTDPDEAAFEEARTDRRLYSFFIAKTAKISDLKEQMIKKEFGFEQDQVKVYFKYKEQNPAQFIMDIEQFDIEEDILICITINAPRIHIPAIVREPLDDIKIADVRLINSRPQNEGKTELLMDLDNFDVDQDKLPWPVYRDWTGESSYLSNIIVKDKTALLNDEQAFLLQQGLTKHLHSSTDLAELAEAEAAYRKLSEEFKRACLYAVHMIVKKNPTPLNLFNLYGDDGDKYIVGGVLVRRAKEWSICGQPFTEANKMVTTTIQANGGEGGSNLIEISGKIASLDVRNLAALRNRISRLVVPLACLVDYFGIRFECQSLAPLSINSLVYGSDLNGLTFTNKDEHAEQMALQIATLLNLKPHYIEEQATLKLKQSYLPYTVQLHRNKDLQEDFNLYLVNPFRLFPQDETLRQSAQVVPFFEIMGRQLRPELVVGNNKGEPDPECMYFTWRKPTKCDECGEWIHDHEYYYYEKKSVDKTQRLLVQYYCCVNCFMEKLPTENFKHPVNKIVKKELQPKEKLQFYQNMNTGRRYFDVQFSKVPLNADAYFHLSNGKDKADKISEQEEILRAAQKLKDEHLQKLIEELNNVDEDPQSSEQLEQLIHSRGINMRHLGLVCTKAELNHIRELCVIEVIARSAKLLIKDGLTFLSEDEDAGFKSANIKQCVLHYMHEIFNTDDSMASSAQSIWDFITEHARKKFSVTIERDVLSRINMHGLFQSLCQRLNIRIRKPLKEIDFNMVNPNTGKREFITIHDIENISPIVKDYIEKQPVLIAKEEVFPSSLNIVLESARLKDSQGKRSQWFMRGGEERDEATDLYRLACSICDQVLGPQCFRYALVLKEFAEQLESRHQEKGRPENSRWNKSFAIPEDDLSSEARFYYNTSLQTLKELRRDYTVEAAQIYTALSRLVKPRSAQFANYREQDSGSYDVFQNLMQAIDIYEIILGFDHPETADAYTKMALAYQEMGNFSAASPWIRRAFTVFYKSFGPHDPITQSAYEQLKSIETNVDSKLDQVPFEDLPSVIFEIEKQNVIHMQQL